MSVAATRIRRIPGKIVALALLGSFLGTSAGAQDEAPAPTPRQALDGALAWLATHQDEDGGWDADEFMKHDPAEDRCDGAGAKQSDVGVTGLALLALLGDGNTTSVGPEKDNVFRGLSWLRKQQDRDTGCFGTTDSHEYMYGHAIATYAMCTAHMLSGGDLFEKSAQMAVNFILRARNPYGAWRYDMPPIGDNDTSVTGWCVLALHTARKGGLRIDPAAIDGALAWFDEVSDPATGRCGYDSFGSMSSRTPRNEGFPREPTEAMTAVALHCRLTLGQTTEEFEILDKHADLIARSLPKWTANGHGTDMYYWYHGTRAMRQISDTRAYRWNEALHAAVLGAQRTDGAAKGSWDPIGPWGYAGGRVYATALLALCLCI